MTCAICENFHACMGAYRTGCVCARYLAPNMRKKYLYIAHKD